MGGTSPLTRTTPRQWLALAVLSVAAFGGGVLLRQAGPVGADVSGQVEMAEFVEDRTSPSSGPADARIVLHVFTDYQCGPCRAGHPAMVAAVQEAGDVRIVYRDLPRLGPLSQRAARVALAAREQGLYQPVHDALMRERRQLSEPVLREIVERAGGDWAQAKADLTDPAIDRQLTANTADALRLGVAGTPTYLIGSYRVTGVLSEREFAKAFKQARE